MKDDDLKPCPFCGTRARFALVFGREGIICNGCEATMRSMSLSDDRSELAKQWNSRKGTE